MYTIQIRKYPKFSRWSINAHILSNSFQIYEATGNWSTPALYKSRTQYYKSEIDLFLQPSANQSHHCSYQRISNLFLVLKGIEWCFRSSQSVSLVVRERIMSDQPHEFSIWSFFWGRFRVSSWWGALTKMSSGMFLSFLASDAVLPLKNEAFCLKPCLVFLRDCHMCQGEMTCVNENRKIIPELWTNTLNLAQTPACHLNLRTF